MSPGRVKFLILRVITTVNRLRFFGRCTNFDLFFEMYRARAACYCTPLKLCFYEGRVVISNTTKICFVLTFGWLGNFSAAIAQQPVAPFAPAVAPAAPATRPGRAEFPTVGLVTVPPRIALPSTSGPRPLFPWLRRLFAPRPMPVAAAPYQVAPAPYQVAPYQFAPAPVQVIPTPVPAPYYCPPVQCVPNCCPPVQCCPVDPCQLDCCSSLDSDTSFVDQVVTTEIEGPLLLHPGRVYKGLPAVDQPTPRSGPRVIPVSVESAQPTNKHDYDSSGWTSVAR